MAQFIPSSDHVSANYRYIAAYNEVNARISQRQHALALYITLVVGLIAAIVASKQIEEQGGLLTEWLMYGFPVASVCLTLLNYKYEQILTNLRQYLSELERLNNITMHLPSYNTEMRWAIVANKARQFHSFACAVLVAARHTIALGVFYKIYPERFMVNSPAVWVTAIAAVISVAALLWVTRLGYKPRWRNSSVQ